MDYLLLGPEEGEKNEWLADERKRVLAKFPDAEIHQFYVGDDTGEAVSSVLSQSSLFSSFRLVIVKQFENRSGKDGIAKFQGKAGRRGGDNSLIREVPGKDT